MSFNLGLEMETISSTSNILFTVFCKRVYSKRKECAARESKVFPFRTDPFQKEIGVQESKQEVTRVTKICLPCQNGENLSCIFLPKEDAKC